LVFNFRIRLTFGKK